MSGRGASLPGDWDGLVVVVAGSTWDGVRYGVQHVASGLTRYAPVLFVDPPLSRLTVRNFGPAADALEGPRLRVVAPRLARLTPVVLPGKSRPPMVPVTGMLLRRALRRTIAQLGVRPDALLVFAPDHRLLRRFGERVSVYYAKDDFGAAAGLAGLSSGHMRAAEDWAAANADVIVAASPVLRDKWAARGYDPVLVPNGVDHRAFADVERAPLPPDVRVPSPVVGFVGHLSDRIDLDLLEAVADRGLSLLLVGPRQWTFASDRMAKLLERPNVQWVDRQPFEALPSYLRVIDVAVLPYADTAFNRASFPLKLLEYLAAGRPVVATDLPSVRWLDTDLVTVATSPTDFADAVERVLARPGKADDVARRRAFAAEHSWERRVELLARTLGIGAVARP